MRPEKKYAVEEIARQIESCCSMILTTFTGLDSIRMNLFRRMVNGKAGHYSVVKNSTFGIAAKERGLERLCAFLKGQVGVVFGEDDSLSLLRAIVNFGKENEGLKVLGGVFEGQVRSAEEMVAITVLPPREVVAGALVGTLASPLSGVVYTLSELLRSLVFVISSIGEKKDSSVSKEGN